MRSAGAGVLLTALLGGASGTAWGQRGVAIGEGALFLVLPLGARAIATGQSVASPEPGTEQLYWNSAGIARATRREVAFNSGSFYVGPMFSLAALFPLGTAGVVGASASVLDYGSEASNDPTSQTGVFSQQAYVFQAVYAATFGSHLNAGVALENALFVASCSGFCGVLTSFHVSSSAVNAGVQYRLLRDGDLVLAASLRHAGSRFQVNDEPQADPLPTRLQIGASYRIRKFEEDLRGAQLRVSADVIDRARHPGDAAPRFGADLSWHDEVRVGAGYVSGSGEGTGAAVGIGFSPGHASVGVSQTIGGTGDANRSATYVSLRYRW
ncbi:MAG TPA: hypothetical protein VE967_08120 [Gemmatimonadaceae bacterium]|nr:hypothetical protein [Gemmatimonadaceae bacterium]